MSKSQSLKKWLQKAIERGYQTACHFWKVVVYRRVVFKGFFNPEIGQKILNNPEILISLGVITPQQKKILEEELTGIVLAKSGVALPTKTETWIVLNPYYLEAEYSQRLALDIVETIAHEVAHAIVFNWDIYWGHVEPHQEITEYLQDYYLNNLGYYLIIQEQGTNQQKEAFSQWSYELGTNGLFTLRQDNKYWLIANYQVLSELKSIKSVEAQEGPKKEWQEWTANNQANFYQQYQTQEIQRLKRLLEQKEAIIEKQRQEKQELTNLVLNRNYIHYQLFNQQVQTIKSKKGKSSQYDKEQLEYGEIVLSQLQQERRELKAQLGRYTYSN